MGLTLAVDEIISGHASAFLSIWLAGWSIGGLFAVYTIYRIFRKSAPEELLLSKPTLSMDTGVAPFKMSFGITNQMDYWKSMFVRRKKIEFSQKEIKTLKLRETQSGNRLTIDKNSERIELAKSASEIEREWLFHYLSQSYFI